MPEPTPTYVAGFKQWLSLGRHVEKGQSGYAILAPVTARFASSTPENAGSWRRLARGEKPRPRRGRPVQADRAAARRTSGTSPRPTATHPRAPAPAAAAGSGARGAVGRAGRPDHRAGLRAAAGVRRRGDRRRQRADRLHHPRGVGPDGHGRRRPGQDARPRARPRHAPRPRQISQSDATLHRGIAEVEAESRRADGRRRARPGHRAYTVPYVSSWASQRARQEPGRGRPAHRRAGARRRRRDPRQPRHHAGRRRRPARPDPRHAPRSHRGSSRRAAGTTPRAGRLGSESAGHETPLVRDDRQPCAVPVVLPLVEVADRRGRRI